MPADLMGTKLRWEPQEDIARSATIAQFRLTERLGFGVSGTESRHESSLGRTGITAEGLEVFSVSNSIPEPTTLAIFGALGMAGIATRRRRKQTA